MTVPEYTRLLTGYARFLLQSAVAAVIISFCAITAAQNSMPSPGEEPRQSADPGPHMQPTTCADCHNGNADRQAYVPPHRALADSVHADLDCTDCHESVSMDDLRIDSVKPHGESTVIVDGIACSECHEEEAEVYKKHGRLAVRSDPDIPSCWSCHGAHDVYPSTDRRSHVHPVNLPGTCRTCHTDVDLVKKHDVLRDSPIKLYQDSVHGTATSKGIYVAATCGDCHSADGPDGEPTAHRILSAADTESTIYHFAIPDTCGKCHAPVTRDYWDGIHGQLVKRGSVDSPVCTHCHGEHGIISPDDPHSPVSSARLAEETCAPCHESAVLNQKYGKAGGELASYVDSYHGLKSKAGDATVANCASCHGSHRVLPSADRASSIHPDNLRATCGECHPNITAELAQTKIHETAAGIHAGWPEFFRKLYIVLIVATIGGMLLHNGADWVRRVMQMGGMPCVQRLSANEVAQHWVLMLSFVVLVISGFSLRFSEAGWVRMLFGWDGGFEVRGIIHRIAAVAMVVGSVWHVFYLFTARGRHWFKDMCPAKSDLVHLQQNVMFFVGLRDQEPRFKRFSYVEKSEYWALVWGTIIMTCTGLLLWFDNYFVESWGMPKVLLDVALVIHFYEAWLAALAIVVWHIYGTVLKPTVYPMNIAWLSGRMPKHLYAEEHPDGPRLKARTLTVRLEDEEEPGSAAKPGEIQDANRESAEAEGENENIQPAARTTETSATQM